jgi:4-hydroxybenzoate polyprenyltransferase
VTAPDPDAGNPGTGTLAPGPGALVAGLVRACHPAPTVAVTAFATVLGVVAGNQPATCVLLAAAILCGQLSIGWSNDRIDAVRDATAHRADKPVATGSLPAHVLDLAIALAVTAVIPLSLLLGWRAGLTHLAAVGCGWAYNVRLKSSWWSWLPYAAAFGALPAIATLALPAPRLPGGWAVAGAALLGVSAHLGNALPDLDDDHRTGVRGLPHHLDARGSLLLAAVLSALATTIIVLGPHRPVGAFGSLALALAGLALVAGARLATTRPVSPVSFYGVMAMAALNLVLLLARGGRLR